MKERAGIQAANGVTGVKKRMDRRRKIRISHLALAAALVILLTGWFAGAGRAGTAPAETIGTEPASRSGEKTAGRAESDPAEAIRAELAALIREQTAGKTAQEWIDGALTDTAEGVGGWYLIALKHLGVKADYTRPRRALEARFAEAGQAAVTKRERMALTLLALGSRNPAIDETADRAAEETTLMPLVFGLHLMNNGAGTEENRRRTAEKILALQLADGGWAVIGTDCDVDCTAMTLQALAGFASADPAEPGGAEARAGGDAEEKTEKTEERENSGGLAGRVSEAIIRGTAALEGIQQENGGFLGMGLESAESCAQVLLALSDLGIDGAADARFRRPEGDVLEALMRFRIPGEGFSHDRDAGVKNDTATVQGFYALAGYRQMLTGGGPYYLFAFPEEGTWAEEAENPAAAAASAGGGTPISVRGWLEIAIGALLALSWAAALKRKKRNWRSYVFPLLVALAAAAAVAGIDIQTPEGYYAGGSAARRNTETRISIRCDAIAGENAYAPADGIILSERSILVGEGETAFDQLLEATRENRIQMEYDGTTAGAYIRGIGYLYEYAFGNLSGWMYRVNGVFADVGCSQYRLKEGDLVEWVYTRNLGKDQTGD